jgi:hypothetical protein
MNARLKDAVGWSVLPQLQRQRLVNRAGNFGGSLV